MTTALNVLGTGVPGLDELLNGGLITGRMYLVRGEPGSGKTMLGMEFLNEGLDNGETVLFIHGEESREDIIANGAELGVDLSSADFLDLGPESDFFAEEQSYDLVDPQDIESNQFIDDIRDAIEELDPNRVCIDPITQLRYVEASDYQFRKRLISFMRFLKDRGTTVLATRTMSTTSIHEDEIASLSDGIIELGRGDNGRRIAVPKHRGVGQRDGDHGLAIREGGIEVYPSLIPQLHDDDFPIDHVSTGIDKFDALLGGGIETGTATFISGPTGVGKSTTATQILTEAAEHGHNPAAYLFEESMRTFCYRSEALGLPVRDLHEDDKIAIEPIEPLAMTVEEFARKVQQQVESRGTDIVMIDGVDGYRMSLHSGEDELTKRLHGLIRYLKNMGVTVFLLDESDQVIGMPSATSSNISYIADNIIFLNYIEMGGELRKVVGVLKKRVGGFEHTLREFSITSEGINLGDPLTGIQGVLDGAPSWLDSDPHAE